MLDEEGETGGENRMEPPADNHVAPSLRTATSTTLQTNSSHNRYQSKKNKGVMAIPTGTRELVGLKGGEGGLGGDAGVWLSESLISERPETLVS